MAAGAACASVAPATLSFACGGACGPHLPCMRDANATSAAGSGADCRCFVIDKSTPTRYGAFNFLIPFDAATSAALASARLAYPNVVPETPGVIDTDMHAWANNSQLKRIEPLDLFKTTTTVSLLGGASRTAMTKGFVATVDLDPKFLANQPQVTWLVLGNLNLTASIGDIAANLPTDLQTLDLRNTLTREFPAALTKLKVLRSLDLSLNDIEQVTADHSMPDITRLYLFTNKVTSFAAVYPKLTTLDLAYNELQSVPEVLRKHSLLKELHLGGNSVRVFNSTSAPSSITTLTLFGNNLAAYDTYFPDLEYLDLMENGLTAFPAVIFSHSKLRTLLIDLNPQIEELEFTNEQANFLNTMSKFTISTTSLRTDCGEAQQFKFITHQFTVCIKGGLNKTTIMSSPRIVAPAPNSSTTTPTDVPSPAPTSTATVEASSGMPMSAVIGVAVVLIVLVALGFLFLERRRRSSTGGKKNVSETETFDEEASSRVRADVTSLWEDDVLLAVKVAVADIKDVKLIGTGAFADVWLVRFCDSELKASKRLRSDVVTRAKTQAFVEEIKLVSALKHPNIVELQGAAWTKETDLQALFEYMDNGDLRNYLTAPDTAHEWTVEKLQIAIDIAEALVYVHSFNPPLVHRDLKSRNVLLNADMRAKLTDFGVSRAQSQEGTMTEGVGTGRWLAPEVITGDGTYGTPADIFSFGAVLSELDTHQIPYSDLRTASGKEIVEVALLRLVSVGDAVPRLGEACPAEIAEIATRCFSLEPAKRPTALEVAYKLRTLKKRGLLSDASSESI